MKHLTREEAIEKVGLENVEDVETENGEPTSRLMPDGDTRIEYSASVFCPGRGEDGVDVTLTAFYYPDESEFLDADGEPLEDLSLIDWEIEFYTVG